MAEITNLGTIEETRVRCRNDLAEALGLAHSDGYSEFTWNELLTMVVKQRNQIIQGRRALSDEA